MPSSTAIVDVDEDPSAHGIAPPEPLWLLAAALHRRPDDALRDDLETGRLAAVVRALANELDLEVPSYGAPPWPAPQAAWAALYSATPAGLPAPPYVGLALDGELMGPATQRLAQLYAREGLAIDSSRAEAIDHVSVVAEAGAVLVGAGRIDAARELLSDYLAPWLETYAPAVQRVDPTFFGPLSILLRDASREVRRANSA